MAKPLLLLLLAVQGALSVTFMSDDVIGDHRVIYACVGKNVTFPWSYILDLNETLIDIEWSASPFHADYEDLIATYVAGHFFPVPRYSSVLRGTLTLSFVPNAGLAIDNVTSSCCNGNISVSVTVDRKGSTIRARRTVLLNAGETDLHCPNHGDELRLLRQKYEALQHTADFLRQQNDNLTQLVTKLQTPCNSGAGNTTARAASCAEVKAHMGLSGVYTIYPDHVTAVQVYCDQDTDGGGWTVFQRRVDGSLDFYRNWTDYENGFGLLSSEFWLGLKNIYLITQSEPQSLRVDLRDFEDNQAFEVYHSFNLSGPSQHYKIHVEGFHGTAGDSIISNSSYYTQTSQDMPFSTPDRDLSSGRCTQSGSGCWWYNWCADGNLNAKYGTRTTTDNWSRLTWRSWYKDYRSLRGSQMKLRPAA